MLDRQRDRQIDRQKDKATDRQVDWLRVELTDR